MSKARTSTAPTRPPSLLQQAQARREKGDVQGARALATQILLEGGADAEGASTLLALTTPPLGVYAYAGIAATILVLLVTLAGLRY